MLYFSKKLKKTPADIIILQLCTKSLDDLQFLRYWMWQTEIGNYGSFFLPFYLPLKNPKNQDFEKMKKLAGDIIVLQMCTKNYNHMSYSSWDMEWYRRNFL